MRSSTILMFCLSLMVLLVGSLVHAEEQAGWSRSMTIDATTTQATYSDSWTGGEAGSVNWVANLNGSVEKQLSPSFGFRSTLKLSFGQTLTQDPETKVWSRPKKSTDLIDFENVGRITRKWLVDPFVAFRLETQFLDASVDSLKRSLSPMKLTESVGMAKQFYKQDKQHITSRLGLALRQILTKQITGATVSTETTTDGGLESVTDVVKTFDERLQYTGKLTIYKALFFSGSDRTDTTAFAGFWKTVDFNWENIFSASITKLITVNFYTQLLYDKEISKRGRFKETLGIGFVYRMI